MSLPPAPEADWQRLDRRMLVVEPFRAVKDFLPFILIALFLNRRELSEAPWQLLAAVFPIVWGVLRFYSTRFRISQGRLELRTGLVNRRRLSTPLERIRTIDLTAGPLQRVLGLTTMKLGTGVATVGDGEFVLDGLAETYAEELRVQLLANTVEHAEDLVSSEESAPASTEALLVKFDPKWAKYGPFTTAGLAAPFSVLAGAAYLFSEFSTEVNLDQEGLFAMAAWVLISLVVLVVLALAVVTPIGAYLLSNWGFQLSRDAAAFHIRRGLLTTRKSHLDVNRVAGVTVHEELPLRLVGGARVTAIATGTNLLEDDTSLLLPAASRAAADQVASSVLGDSAPIDQPLKSHGAAAIRRRWTRALSPALAVTAGAIAVVWTELLPAWLLLIPVVVVPGALILAVDRTRTLGHLLADGFIVFRSGSLFCEREVLRTDQIISWNITSNWFQRRAGLVDLVATTAGGSTYLTGLDLPAAAAVDLADQAVPGLVSQFLSEPTLTKTT